MSPDRTGFTLLELLVALAVVLVLAALLLPVLSMARQASRRAQCLSQIRQLGMAFLAYTSDADGFLPHEDNGDSLPPFGCGWFEVLDTACRQCPGIRGQASWRSYKMNSLLEEGSVAFLNLNSVAEPSRTVLAFDGRTENAGVRSLPKGTWEMAAPRHGTGTTVVFCDGHAAWVRARFDASGWDGPNGLEWSP